MIARVYWRHLFLVAAPLLLMLSCWAVFSGLAQALERRTAYLLGFLFYWLFWCLAVPVMLIGRRRVRRLFRIPKGRAAVIAAALPLVFAYAYEFPRAVSGATPLVILLSFALAVVNGMLEELFWRGAYVTLFPRSTALGWLYPALCFGVWHIVPQQLVPSTNPGGAAAFATFATLLGLAWGWSAQRARSILPTSIAHVLFDFSGMGARLYLA